MCDSVSVLDDLWWREKDVQYIRNRSERYPNATNIEPEWAMEVAADPDRIIRDPDPKSRDGYIRLVGYSPTAEFAITVIIEPLAHAGVTAWKTRGADLREYLEGKEADS